MADTVLGGRWKIHYEAENRQKRLERDTTVSATTIDSVNALYSALQDQFDELTQMDDGSPMSAQTPTEYTVGIIDAGDKDPWFMDRTSMEYLKGGAIKTASWLRAVGTNTGIVRIEYTTTTALDPTDIGRDILSAHADADRGTILDFNATVTPKVMWIRPDSSAATNSFDATATFSIPNEAAGQVWQVDVSAGDPAGFNDQTAAANDATSANWTIFPATEENTIDYAAIGFRQKFSKVIFDNAGGTAGTVGVVLWEFWNGSSWADLEAVAGFSDGTSDFKAAVSDGQTLSWTGTPTGWATTSLAGSASLYYIRARVTTLYTVNPIYDQIFIGTTGVGSISAVATSGESLWANIYSLGSIEFATHLYVYQNAVILKKYKSTTIDWWGDGQIDILVAVKEVGVEVDEGFVTVFARQYSKTYDNFIVDLTAGGRNPIPLATGGDLNNTTGYRQFTGTGGAGTFNVNNFIYVGTGPNTWATATKRGRITKVAGTTAAPILDYYLLGDLTYADFALSDTVREFVESTNADGDATCTAAAPVNVGPALFQEVTADQILATHAANTTFDIDEVAPNENYSIVIDLSKNGDNVAFYTVAQGYEWSKYVTRGGFTGTAKTDGIEGERYIGSEYRIAYTTLVGTVSEGAVVTQVTSLAKGTVVAHHAGTIRLLILRNTRGTFNNTNNIEVDASNRVEGPTSTAITAIKAAPFGTFAGGTWFGAPGVVFKNTLAADANKYQLTDDNGNVVKAPTKVTISVGNTIANDKVAVFRLTGALGTIKKDTYSATAQAIDVTTVVVTPNIAVDEPGKSAGGILRLVDASASQEFRIRFSSWTTATFTLASATLTAEATTTSTTIVVAGAFTAELVKVGDLIRNSTRNAVTYVTARNANNNEVTVSPAVTGQVSGDTIKKNVLPVATTISPQDTVYVPLIDSFETTGTAGATGTEEAVVTFSLNIPVRVRARRTTATAILPYEADSTVTSAGMSNNIIRTADTIFT